MIRVAAPLALVAAPAAAQTSREQAAGEVKAILEGVRAPMYDSAGAVLAGVSATYSASGAGCTTTVDVAYPRHTTGGTNHPPRTDSVPIDWSRVRSVRTEGSYAVVAAPGFAARGSYFYAGSADGAARLKTAMDALARACAAAPPAAPAGTGTSYVPIDVRTDGGERSCSFAAAPHIRLGRNFIVYSVNPVAGQGTLRVYRRYLSGSAANLQDATLTIESPAFARTAIAAVRVGFDARKPNVVNKLGHGQGEDDEPGSYPTHVTIEVDGALRSIAESASLVITALDASGRDVAEAQFDTREFRHFEPIAQRRANGCG